MDFSNKTVLVTGANRGLGFVLANVLSDVNAKVHGTSRRAAQYRSYVTLHRMDARVPAEVNHVIDCVKPDILINNAAITDDATVHKMTGAQWRNTVDVNLNGVFNCIRAALPHMRKKGYGRIVNIVSVLAHTGCAGAANYAASKAGVIGLTKSVALENAYKGITCNAVALGFMGTGMCDRLTDNIKGRVVKDTPMGRFGTPEEAADAVMFLASDRASFITGEVLNVNGGYRLD